jgi:hypothetical protein
MEGLMVHSKGNPRVMRSLRDSNRRGACPDLLKKLLRKFHLAAVQRTVV